MDKKYVREWESGYSTTLQKWVLIMGWQMCGFFFHRETIVWVLRNCFHFMKPYLIYISYVIWWDDMLGKKSQDNFSLQLQYWQNIQQPFKIFSCTIIKPLSAVNQTSTAIQTVIAVFLGLSAFLLSLHNLDVLHPQSWNVAHRLQARTLFSSKRSVDL